ncbi:CLUMA_CG016150, isoform A [Clunio marinus]|uniref:CLUMA_CG016150, isoform A n=1 Tax=Clunio marinus TaxID=568069 RepID=A0A1J1ISR7_9DIPT|nr:CLUMA_CG016150, isoform A [Clunio marinus]
MISERLDVIIFGATGYTGRFTVCNAVKLLEGLNWGIAGRCEEKLKNVLLNAGEKVKKNLSIIPIIIADINDQHSLIAMAKQAKVIVNCCGPYHKFGEQVVSACIEGGAHQVDLSAEPHHMEVIQLKYDAEAREKNVYIVSGCGFDSIPAEMGTIFLHEKFDGTLNSVEMFLYTNLLEDLIPKARVNYGTWESIIYVFAHYNELRQIRCQLFPTRTPSFEPKMPKHPLIYKSDVVGNRWCLPFPNTDRSVVLRTHRYFYDKCKKRPIQLRSNLVVDSFLHVVAIVLFAAIALIMLTFSCSRKLMLRHSKLFSFGLITKEGPKDEINENSYFDLTLVGEGWAEKFDNEMEDVKLKTNKRLRVQISAENPGYGATCIAVLLSAKTILNETSKIPQSGGVLTPGVAFQHTSLINELQRNGFTFKVLNE